MVSSLQITFWNFQILVGSAHKKLLLVSKLSYVGQNFGVPSVAGMKIHIFIYTLFVLVYITGRIFSFLIVVLLVSLLLEQQANVSSWEVLVQST